MFPTTVEDTVARLAVRIPAATRVFMRYGIDFCCGGQRPLTAACAERGLDAAAILAEIGRESAEPEDQRWDERPLGELVSHIVGSYHRPLDEELPRLLGMAKKVLTVHGERDPERLSALVEVCEDLFTLLVDHMQREEAGPFLAITSAHVNGSRAAISALIHEHDDVAVALSQIRTLTGDFTPPPGACNTWRALWLGLETFDRDLRAHVHLENNVLFPRALAS